jgi:GNAT superfamily N-acetyltransferase
MRSAAPRLAELPDPGAIWSVTCFVVAPGYRRKGIAAALLQAAVEHAFTHGAAAVEAYPVDPVARPKAGPADLYQGPLPLFVAAGFSLVDTTTPGRAVVRLDKVSG